MKKRDFTSAFDENHSSIDTGISLDDAVHGIAPKLDTGRIVAKPISIFEIYPDPMQPRRAIPSSVRERWDGNPSGVKKVLSAWLSAVSEERGEWFDLREHLLAEGDSEADRRIGPIEKTILSVIDIAASVYRDGLTNPITVTQHASGYRLETGERRWLAYHLLHAEFEDEQWNRIPTRVIEAASIWRQAAENNARDNLNAIAKARQFALLLMDLLSNDAESPVHFRPFETFKNEHEFYAQVADGARYRIPKGKSEQLYSAMGFNNRNQVSDYRRLLTLPDKAWQIADDYNVTEFRLRTIMDEAKGRPDLIVHLVHQAAAEYGDMSSTDDISRAAARTHRQSSNNRSLDLPQVVSTFNRNLRKTHRHLAEIGDWQQQQIEQLMHQTIEKMSAGEKDEYRRQLALEEMLIKAAKRWL